MSDLFGITTIYVYCNIFHPQIVGDTSSHLLRTIPVNGKSGDIIAKTFGTTTRAWYACFQGEPMAGGYGQTGYGLGGLFRNLARRSMPLISTGAKVLGKIALKSGADFLGDVLSGKNVKEAAKARTVEAAHVAKRKAINKVMGQTGSGKHVKRTAKKRKASVSTAIICSQTKKRKTA